MIGLGGLGGASIAFGGRFERIFKALPDLGEGLLGIQVGVDWWSWDQSFGTNSSSISWIPIGVTANYHFKMENKKVDPFLGHIDAGSLATPLQTCVSGVPVQFSSMSGERTLRGLPSVQRERW